MVVLSILVLLECLDDLEGLLQLGIKGRAAQTQWPSRVRVPHHAGGVYPGLSRPDRDRAGACGALTFPPAFRSTPPPAWSLNRASAPCVRYLPANKPLISID